MPNAIDLTGRVFNMLTVVRFLESRRSTSGHMIRMYEVRCECGTVREAVGTALSYGSLKSCGCAKRNSEHSLRHGHARKGKYTREYQTWCSMIRRCHTPGASGFVKYGAKGVTVCQRWRDSYETFFADMGPRPSDGHSIDRIDSGGNYEPGNCRWATRSQQSLNRRPYTRKKRKPTFRALAASWFRRQSAVRADELLGWFRETERMSHA